MNPDPTGTPTRITVVSGGVGAARFLAGLIDAIDDLDDLDDVDGAASITAVVNTGDDCMLHGLSISPDLDTVTYTLAGAIDPERGWGLVDESWRAMESLERYESVRPDGSSAAPRWFNLGDRDLATHFFRTARLAEGASLTEVTDEIRRAWQVPIRIVPMSDDRLSTIVTITDEHGHSSDVSFQDYFVRLRHSVPVTAVRFDGTAGLADDARLALRSAHTIVIAPSNPIVSIGPIRSLPGVEELLADRRERTVAVSPIVGGAALKGPADRMLTELGHDASVVGVARLYAPIASVLVIDPVDAHLADDVEAQGMRCVVTPSVMSTPDRARDLATVTIRSIQRT
ncbi:MAG TPA: 2-phospho-L-lactate transferase [Ilumatobacteraceae bacterium]|nr:2-phospho-L-lactate transferase [Ilumatobacteraceae bacterium]